LLAVFKCVIVLCVFSCDTNCLFDVIISINYITGGWDALVSGAAQIRIEGLYNVEGVGTVYAGTGNAC
jgi:hypothetical protein